MKITPTSLTVSQLLGSASEQYVIPAYQRRYSWRDRQLWELIEDIELIEGNDTHLLGSIVCLTGHHTAGLNQLELVDGQQRLTTISILLECIRERFEEHGLLGESQEVARYLAAKPMGGQPARKVSLDSIDSLEFDRLVKKEFDKEFDNRHLCAAFDNARDWAADIQLEALGVFFYRLMNQAIIIRLDVSEAKDAFKLFETINNRGLKLSPTDLIKNFLLGNAARVSDEALQSSRNTWTSLIHHLDGTNTDAFFRAFLMAFWEMRISATQVVNDFKLGFMQFVKEAASLPDRHQYFDSESEESSDNDIQDEEEGEDGDSDESTEMEIQSDVDEQMSLQDFLLRLANSAKAYGELVLAKTGNAKIDRHLRNLQLIRAMPAFSFLTHLRVSSCSDKEFGEVLKLTEALILRRHVCRERTNDTETLFGRLCAADMTTPLETVRTLFREYCPSDEKFRDEFATASFKGRLTERARYCLETIEVSLHGDYDEVKVLGSEAVQIEHIMPQKITTKKSKAEYGDWISYLGAESSTKHSKYVSRIGNLTILAGELNLGASNNPFDKKKKAYKETSLLLTKALCELPRFDFDTIDARSKELAELAVKIWPMP
jgi:hypothetical protein